MIDSLSHKTFLTLSSFSRWFSLHLFNYIAYQGFGQAKLGYEGLVLGLGQFLLLPRLPKKYCLR